MKITRRRFIKGAAALAGALTLTPAEIVEAQTHDYPDPIVNVDGVRYTSCLQCHNSCTARVKIVDGVAEKVEGNPYSPMNLNPPIPYDTPPDEGAKHVGRLCPKGQSIIQTTYDPYRVTQPLKRVGPRGSGRWKAISWDQAYDEIVSGGNLFGEGQVDGLRDIRSFEPIDPNVPELGPKANQFVFMMGRAEHGRKDIIYHWTKEVFGSVNAFEHTTICEQSHHIGIKHSTDYGRHHISPNIENCEFLLIVGANPVEANFGPTNLAAKLTKAKTEGNIKIVTVDPRLSRTAAISDEWVPIKPGTDGAFAMGLISWIIDNEKYDKTFLTNPNKKAANMDGEPSWSNATYLVKIGDIKEGEPGALLKASEAGIGSKDEHVVLIDGEPAVAEEASGGDLEVDTTVNGIKVKSAFTLLKEKAKERSLDELAEICGVESEKIRQLAQEFTSHGKRAHTFFYRGPAQHTNGFYNARALATLNILIGNLDWKGGWQKGGHQFHERGGKKTTPYDMADIVPPAKDVKAGGVPITREGWKYEEAETLFEKEGYPAKRPWFPFTSSVYQEILPSAADRYPYPIKALFLIKGTPALSVPASEEQRKILQDTDAVPLLVASDIVIGETSMYADYILPDTSILERWGMPHTSTDILQKTSKIRQPVIEPLGDVKPIEQILIDLSERLGIPGWGEGERINSPESMYLKMVANVAEEKEGVPQASPEEMKRFERFRQKDPGAVTTQEWEKSCYVLSRGCRVEPPEKAYDGKYMGHKYAGPTLIYDEKSGTTRDSITGEKWSGLPEYKPIQDLKGNPIKDKRPLTLITHKEILGGQSRTISNKWLQEIKDWGWNPMNSKNIKRKLKEGKIGDVYGNWVVMNSKDAQARNLETGDQVKVISKTNNWEGVVGQVLVVEGIRPGVVDISWHYGHWAYGSESTHVNGAEKLEVPDKERAAGICPNSVMRVDTSVGRTPLQDPIGGSASYFDTKVEVLKL